MSQRMATKACRQSHRSCCLQGTAIPVLTASFDHHPYWIDNDDRVSSQQTCKKLWRGALAFILAFLEDRALRSLMWWNIGLFFRRQAIPPHHIQLLHFFQFPRKGAPRPRVWRNLLSFFCRQRVPPTEVLVPPISLNNA